MENRRTVGAEDISVELEGGLRSCNGSWFPCLPLFVSPEDRGDRDNKATHALNVELARGAIALVYLGFMQWTSKSISIPRPVRGGLRRSIGEDRRTDLVSPCRNSVNNCEMIASPPVKPCLSRTHFVAHGLRASFGCTLWSILVSISSFIAGVLEHSGSVLLPAFFFLHACHPVWATMGPSDTPKGALARRGPGREGHFSKQTSLGFG